MQASFVVCQPARSKRADYVEETFRIESGCIGFHRNTVHTCMLLPQTYSQPESDPALVWNSRILSSTPPLPTLSTLSRPDTVNLSCTIPSNAPTHVVVCRSLGLDTPREPFLSCLSRSVFPCRSAGHCLCDSLALVSERMKFHCVVRTSEEYDRIAFVLGLFLWRRATGLVVNVIDTRKVVVGLTRRGVC